MDDRELLSRYLEGEAGDDERRTIEARLAADAAFAAELAALRQLVDAASALRGEVEPPPAVWSGVLARIGAAELPATADTAMRGRSARPLLAAAVALLVLAGGFLLGRHAPGRPAPGVASVPAAVPAGPSEREWSDAQQALFAARQADGSGADDEVLRDNLAIIDRAVQRLHAALEEDPSNTSLQRLLNAEYRRRSALLRRAAQDPSIRT